MNFTDVIIILIIAAISVFSFRYAYTKMKKGQACIGCPNSSQCGKSKCRCGENPKDTVK